MYKFSLVVALASSICTFSWASEHSKGEQVKTKLQRNGSIDNPKVMKPQVPKMVPKKNAPLKLTALLISLLQVQDRIARGDEAALKLQRHLMKLLDAGIAEHGTGWNISPAQFRALVIFGIVGTGSNSVLGALRQVQEPESDAQLAKAILFYRQRQRKPATAEFAKIEIEELDARLIPFVAFARGNLLSRSRPNRAITSYDIVRLTAPGTLLEETSLRRLMMLYSSQNDGEEFIGVAKQYARRFINSPYRDQYLKMLRAGIFSMRQTISLENIGDLGDTMPANFAVALHMHLLHQAVISGYIKLAEFSIARMKRLLEENADIKVDEAKLALLKILSRIRSDAPVDLLSELQAFDRSKLSANDIKLHNAAADILKTILSPIDPKAKSGSTVKEKTEREDRSSDDVGDVSSGPVHQDKMRTSETENSIEDFIGRTQEKLSQIDVMLSH